MTKFIHNINEYIYQMGIKQTYVSKKSGIDAKKMSRILTGVQDINSADMEKLAEALGQNVEFFLSDEFHMSDIMDFEPEKISFYAGEPTAKQEKIADQLLRLMENVDEVISAKQRFLNITGE